MSRQAFYPHLSVDCVLIGFDEEGLKVLLVEIALQKKVVLPEVIVLQVVRPLLKMACQLTL